MIKILTKIHAKITIIVVENREHNFIIFCKCKEIHPIIPIFLSDVGFNPDYG